MKLMELGAHVKTEHGEGMLIGRTISVTNGETEGWAKPGRSKNDPIYTVQLFDGSLCSNDLTSETPTRVISAVTQHAIDNDPNLPAGLRSFLLGVE